MHALWLRWLLVCAVAVVAFGVGGAASAHLPKVIVVQTDGGTTKVWTFGATVADALKDARVPVGPRDRVTPRYSVVLSAGMRITVRRAFPVLLVVDGGKNVVNTAAATVDEFIEESGVRLRSSDRVYPMRAASLSPGAMVRIVRIDTRVITKEERLPYGRIARPDAALPRGMTRLVQAGRPGTQVRRIAITTADGVVVDRQSLEAVITRLPQDRILGIGIRHLFA